MTGRANGSSLPNTATVNSSPKTKLSTNARVSTWNTLLIASAISSAPSHRYTPKALPSVAAFTTQCEPTSEMMASMSI